MHHNTCYTRLATSWKIYQQKLQNSLKDLRINTESWFFEGFRQFMIKKTNIRGRGQGSKILENSLQLQL